MRRDCFPELTKDVECLVDSRRGDRVKLLWWDRDGLTLYYRRLEEGIFRFPTSNDPQARSIKVSAQELSLVLWGIDPSNVKRQRCYQRTA